MSFENLDLGLNWGGNPTFATNTGGEFVSNDGFFNNLFGFGNDVLSGYLNIKSQEMLLDEQTKLLLAQQQQANLLGTVETPNQVNVQTLTPLELALLNQQGGSGSMISGVSDKTLLIGAAIIAALVLIK